MPASLDSAPVITETSKDTQLDDTVLGEAYGLPLDGNMMYIPPSFSPSLVVYDTGSPVSIWNKPFTLDDDSDDDSDVISCHNYHETSSPSIEVGNGDGSHMTLTGPMVQNAFVDQEWLLAETFLDDDLKFSFLDDNEVTSDDALSCPNYQESPSPYFLHLRFGTILPLLEFEGPV